MSAPGALLLHVDIGAPSDSREFEDLARAAGVAVRGVMRVRRARPDPRFLIGPGQAARVAERLAAEELRLLILSRDLAPSQERNLERVCRARVLDRSGLILDIFARRARSREGQIQVELAQLSYLSTRLVRGWSHLERQKGGIGLRGPGEKQLETDRRLLGRRIVALRAQLAKIRRRRALERRRRRRGGLLSVALVGRTNAGKTTLFNRLTRADALCDNAVFATLDPMVRRLELDGAPPAVLSDTVGFVRDLPPALTEAFEATLLELREADLLLHVRDLSAPDDDGGVRAALARIGAGDAPRLAVFNKADLAGRAPALARDAAGRPAAATVSAASGAGLELLRRAIAERVAPARRCRLRVPARPGDTRAFVHAAGEVDAERYDPAGHWIMHARLDPRLLREMLNRGRVALAE